MKGIGWSNRVLFAIALIIFLIFLVLAVTAGSLAL